MTPQQQLELEAAAFRRLVEHLQKRTDVQNIDLMNLSGFCRNCLSKWYKAAADERQIDVSLDDAREKVYGMPYADWKAQYQKEASADQQAAFEKESHVTDLSTLRNSLASGEHVFADTLAFIAANYSYQPQAFSNGGVENAAGQNEGSCKTLGLAPLEGLSDQKPCWRLASTTAACWPPRRQRPWQHPCTDQARAGRRHLRRAAAQA